MSSFSGFWSYVRRDNEAEGDRIVALAHDIVAQYEMAADDEIELFLDRDSLEWGSEWQKVIDESLASVAFFVPIITPRFFASSSCRNELNTIARRAIDLGVKGLIRPILYADVPGIDDEKPADATVALVKQFQWVDWRELRFSDRPDSAYRREVARLALTLVSANRSSESISPTHPPEPDVAEEEAGTIDLLARYEEAFDELSQTMSELGPRIVEVGEIASVVGAKAKMPQNGTFSQKLGLLRKFSSDLGEPVQAVLDLGESFTAQLHDVDLGMRIIIARAPEEPESTEEFCGLFTMIRDLAMTSEDSFAQMQGMADSIAPLEQLSRELRPTARELRKGISVFVDGNSVIQEWIALIDASGMVCKDSVGDEAAHLLE